VGVRGGGGGYDDRGCYVIRDSRLNFSKSSYLILPARTPFIVRPFLSNNKLVFFRLDDNAFDNPVGLKKLKSLILLTYYDDDNPVQTCEDKLLLKLLKGSWNFYNYKCSCNPIFKDT